MDYKRVLRLHYVNGFSSRAISESTKDGKTTINDFLKRFRESPVLTWPLSEDVTNEMIERLLYQKPGNITNDVYYGTSRARLISSCSSLALVRMVFDIFLI